MKNFSKLLFVLLLLAITSQSFAQVNFGLRIGTNFSKQKYQIDGTDFANNMKMLPGGNLGFILDIPVNESFSIETGLLLNTKGYKTKETDGDDKAVSLNYLAYIDLPINAKYTFDLGGPKFFVTGGPYLAFAVFGKGIDIAEVDGQKETAERDYNIGNDELLDDYKRLDIGFNVGGGFQFGSFVVGATYGFGLLNISPQADYDFVTKNRVLSISIGVNFAR